MPAIPIEAAYVILGICLGAGFVFALDRLFAWSYGLGGARTMDAVRRWWHTGLRQPPTSIKVRRRGGTIEEVRPIRASGLHLMVEPLASGKRTWELIGASDAVDREEFWLIWRYYGGQSSGWVDEDGDEFSPQ